MDLDSKPLWALDMVSSGVCPVKLMRGWLETASKLHTIWHRRGTPQMAPIFFFLLWDVLVFFSPQDSFYWLLINQKPHNFRISAGLVDASENPNMSSSAIEDELVCALNINGQMTSFLVTYLYSTCHSSFWRWLLNFQGLYKNNTYSAEIIAHWLCNKESVFYKYRICKLSHVKIRK